MSVPQQPGPLRQLFISQPAARRPEYWRVGRVGQAFLAQRGMRALKADIQDVGLRVDAIARTRNVGLQAVGEGLVSAHDLVYGQTTLVSPQVLGWLRSGLLSSALLVRWFPVRLLLLFFGCLSP